MDAELVKLILWVIGYIFAAVWAWAEIRFRLKEGKKAKAVGIAEEAVVETYHEFVKGIKAASEDGKLSKDDILEARDLAWARACAIGKERGFNFAKEIAKEYFPVLIDKIIKAVKKSK